MDNVRRKIVITAGPTREPLDPVRFLSNYSTGAMGYAIARQTVKKGVETVLISGPVHLAEPEGARVIKINTALELEKAVKAEISSADCLVMAAAVSDYRPETTSPEKIKKGGEMRLQLVRNPDILAGTAIVPGLIRVGFALETNDPVANGREKLKRKRLDLIVVNTKTPENEPFGEKPQKREYIILSSDGQQEELLATKAELAADLVKRIYEKPGRVRDGS